MGGCCEKRSNAGGSILETKGGTVQGNITSDEIPKLLDYTSKYFAQNPDHEIIAINFGKDMIKSFLANLSKLIGIIKDRTGKIMVPVAIQSSILNPNSEMTVIMRTTQSFQDIYLLGQPLIQDVNLLAGKFILKNFQFMTTETEHREEHLTHDLLSFYAKENLILIGGVQEKNESSSFFFIFYKLDRLQISTDRYQYDIKAELLDSTTKEEIDKLLQKVAIQNSVLRCVISQQNQKQQTLMILQKVPASDDPRVYQFNDFDKQALKDALDKITKQPIQQATPKPADGKTTSTPGAPTLQGVDLRGMKELLMWQISEHLNLLDQSLRSNVQAIVVNKDLNNSLIISVN
eukprot:403343909